MRRTVNEIRGNVSDDLKEIVLHLHNAASSIPGSFAKAITTRMELVSIDLSTDSDSNKEAVVVCEIEVAEGATNTKAS